MSPEARAQMAARQAELVGALVGNGAMPPGFDAERLRAAATGLAVKRRSAVARAWPALPLALGERYTERFDAYAQTSPLPRVGGPWADGRAFLRWLAAQGEFPEACKLPALAVDLRYRTTAAGLVPRRGPALKVAMLGAPRRVVVALRLPWLGETWLNL